MKFKDFGVKIQTLTKHCVWLLMTTFTLCNNRKVFFIKHVCSANRLLVAFWPFVLWAKSIGPQLNFL